MSNAVDEPRAASGRKSRLNAPRQKEKDNLTDVSEDVAEHDVDHGSASAYGNRPRAQAKRSQNFEPMSASGPPQTLSPIISTFAGNGVCRVHPIAPNMRAYL